MCVVWGCVGVAKGDCLRARPKEPYYLYRKTTTMNIIYFLTPASRKASRFLF